MAHFLVRQGHGPEWNPARPRRAQDGWTEHAAFMDALTERGTVLLGGPLGKDVNTGDALLVVAAEDENEVRAVLAADPWHGRALSITSVKRWTLWLGSPAPATSAREGHG